MMMPPIADDIAGYLPRPIQPPMSIEQQQQRNWKPSAGAEAAPNCPRCDSPNTKFCYYNNYSLAQPRYFCKGCRRYWTKGGSLRNVPVGGGCRKNRRGRSSSMRVSQDARGRPAEQAPSSAGQNQQPSARSAGCGGMLEDIAGAASTTTSSSGGTSRASDGSDIDLAVLYAKYLSDQSSEHESPPDGQKLVDLQLPVSAASGMVVNMAPTFDFDYPALGQEIPPDDAAASGGFAVLPTPEAAAQLSDMGFDGCTGQFQYLLTETDGLVDDVFWANSMAEVGCPGSTWQQQQCLNPGDQLVLPVFPDQQDSMLMIGHHQSVLLGGSSWPAIDPWTIDAVTRI